MKKLLTCWTYPYFILQKKIKAIFWLDSKNVSKIFICVCASTALGAGRGSAGRRREHIVWVSSYGINSKQRFVPWTQPIVC